MSYYSVKIGLDSPIQQTEVIDLLKTNGAEVIQTSGGLCVKSELAAAEIEKIIGAGKISIESLNRDSVAHDEELSMDVKRFMGIT